MFGICTPEIINIYFFLLQTLHCKNKRNLTIIHNVQYHNQILADSSIQVIRRVKFFEIGARDSGHAHLGGRFIFPTQEVSVHLYTNLKRIAQFVQKLLKGSRN